jgi:hypothetical protein
MADTAALVVALSAQLTKFEKDMQKAGIMAERAVGDIEGKFSKMNPQINASFLGNLFSNAVTQGINAASKALEDFYNRFIDLEKQARILDLSMEQVWGFQEAARAGGATVEEATLSLRRLADLLAEMKRGDKNSLSELLDANPQAMKGINRDAMTLQQTWTVVAQLIFDAQTGVDKIAVGKLAGQSEGMALSLNKAAGSFDQMQRAAADAAPPLQTLAEQAKLFDGYMKSATEWIKADLAQGIENTRREFETIYNIWRQITGQPMRLIMPLGGPKDEPAKGAGTTVVPPKATGGTEADPFTRAVQNIEKHTAATQANTLSVGQNVGEQERLRIVAELNAVASRNGASATAEQTKRMNEAAEAAGKARLEYAIASERINKLNAASQAFGSALSNSFADAILEGKKLNDVMAELLRSLARMAINSTMMSLFTPGAGQTLSPFASLFKAEGGPVAAGRPYIVGERGPELMIPNQGGMIVPNSALRAGSSGGGSFVYSPAIDARGASVEAVARLAQIIEADRASFASRTVATIQQARRGRVVGL